jgi:outer membrane receptor protein involved in Fe transport
LDWLKNELFWKTQLPPEFRARLQNQNMAFLDNFVQEQSYYRVISYAQDQWTMSERFHLQPGMRLDYFHLLKKYYIEPRVNFSYLINPISTFRAAYGMYYQSPGYEKLVDQNVFYSLSNAQELRAEQATHYIAGYEHWITSEIFGKVETYYKRFEHLIRQKKERQLRFVSEPIPGNDLRRIDGWTAPRQIWQDVFVNIPENNSLGDAYGIEFYIEKKQATPQTSIFGWLSYALAWAQRNSFGVWSPLSYDQRHTFNCNFNFKPSQSFEVAIKWKYGTNFPFSPPSGIQPRIITVHIDTIINNIHLDTLLGFIQVDSDSNIVFDVKRAEGNQVNAGRLPPYHRLDVRLNWYKKFWNLDWTFYLDVINVYNRKNILNYQTFVDSNLKVERNPTTMFPILPTLGMSVRF